MNYWRRSYRIRLQNRIKINKYIKDKMTKTVESKD